MNKKYISYMVVLVVLVGIGSFAGGMSYEKTKLPAPRIAGARGAQFAGGIGGTRLNGGGFTAGEIISKDATSITLKMIDGGSKIVLISDATKVSKMTDGTNKDLNVGGTVSVTGTTNQDGSVSAQSIQIRTTPITKQ